MQVVKGQDLKASRRINWTRCCCANYISIKVKNITTQTFTKCKKYVYVYLFAFQAKVLHTDFGVIENVSVTYLFKLSQELHDYPFQSRPAVLAGLRFPDDNNTNQRVVQSLKSKIKQVDMHLSWMFRKSYLKWKVLVWSIKNLREPMKLVFWNKGLID